MPISLYSRLATNHFRSDTEFYNPQRSTMTVRLPAISAEQHQAIQAALDHFGETLPGCSLTVASDSEILFDGRSGKFDPLEEGSDARAAGQDDVLWFASTTKLITSVGQYSQ